MKRLVFFAVLATCGATMAELTAVSDGYWYTYKADGGGLTATTTKVTEWPSDIPEPMFWFDCTDTNGWEFTVDKGTNFVTKIPSKVGDRFLTTDQTLPGTSWKTWAPGGASWGKSFAPWLDSFDDLPGGPALDFGPRGSRHAMLFDPVSYDAGATTNNVLKNIGTILAVWGSQNGGGYLLGGGGNGYNFERAFDNNTAYGNITEAGYAKWWNFLFRSSSLNTDSTYYFNINRQMASSTGLSAGWDIVAFSPANNNHEAEGLGLGDSRQYFEGRSSGGRFGEMIIFSDILTADQLQRASVYLHQKWLARPLPRTWNGNAQVGVAKIYPKGTVSAELNVPAGETLTVGQLRGGHNPTAVADNGFVKTGAGVLKVRGATDFTGTIKVQEGTVRFARKRGPATAAELPKGLYVHFDASDANCLVTEKDDGDDRLYVKTLRNLADGKWQTGNLYARPRLDILAKNKLTADVRPWVRTVGLASGRPIIDFSTRNADGRYLMFGTNEVMTATHDCIGINGIATAVALVRVEWHGGNLMDKCFQRAYTWVSGDDCNYTIEILSSSAQGTDYTGEVYLNGMKVGAGSSTTSGGFRHRGYHVIAYRVRSDSVTCIGATDYRSGLTSGDGCNQARGGVQLGEILIFNRQLTEEEVLDCSQYLSQKWLKTDIPGYCTAVTEKIPDAQVVKMGRDNLAIDVPAGETLRIRDFETGKHPTTKTGAGTLIVGPESDLSFLSVAGGDVKQMAMGTDVTSDAEVAPGAVLHLDATDTDAMHLRNANGTNYVEIWYGKTGTDYAHQADDHVTSVAADIAARQPWINTDEEALLNGHPVVDFGTYSIYTRSGHPSLYLSDDFDSVRAVYMVVGTQEGGGQVLGERYYADGNWMDFLRYGNMEAGLDRGLFQGGCAAVVKGEVWTNGVLTTYNVKPTGGYELVEVHPSAGTHISGIGQNRGCYMNGGFRLGEIIIYERPLSAREKVATRNYLLAKWFPDVPQQPLPDAPTVEPVAVRQLDVTRDATLDVTDTVAAKGVIGTGTLTKIGTGTLAITDLSGFGGAIDVTAGTLAITGMPATNVAVLATEGRILHLDATDGVQTLTNADSSVSVTNWNSKAGNGWSAIPLKPYTSAFSYPTLLTGEQNENAVVKMQNDGWSGAHHDMLVFHRDGVQEPLSNIRSVFWMIGSQEGGGFVLGGGTNITAEGKVEHRYRFHRGGSYPAGTHPTDAITCYAADGNVRGEKAVWHLNSAVIDPDATGLSGGYDVMSFVQTEKATAGSNAEGLAFDGRILEGEDYRERIGLQRLGELIVYDRIVTAEERTGIEAYLDAKWGFTQREITNVVSVAVAAGATLTLTGNQYLGSLSGAGTVAGDVTAAGLVADFTATAGLTITGALTLDHPVVKVTGVPTGFRGYKSIPVLTAASYANVRTATFEGVPEGVRARLMVKDGQLLLVLGSRGLSCFVK